MENSPELDLAPDAMDRMRADMEKMKAAHYTRDEARAMIMKRYGLGAPAAAATPDPMTQDVPATQPPPVDPSAPLPASTPGEVFSNYLAGPIHDKLNIFLQQALPGMPSTMREM